MSRLMAIILCGLLSAGAVQAEEAASPRPLTILVSIDGFSPTYLERGVAPTLTALAENGATASMKPSFPTVTFPNHYTLVTGLHPDHHGIVGNSFIDPEMGRFTMQSKEPGWWNQAEPIWITAEKAGLTSATMFWPGSEAEIDGLRPTYWRPFDQSVGGHSRVDQLLAWLDEDKRPDLATLYFDLVDTAGHRHGPDAAETTEAARLVDASLARLVQGLKDRGLWERTNLIVVADHGMAATSPDRVTYLDDLIDPAAVQVIYASAVAYLEPVAGHEAEAEAALIGEQQHGVCWRRDEIPERLVLGSNPRVPSIVCMAETGWLFGTRARMVRSPGGAHGYDNLAAEMRALFIAHGPAIASGVVLTEMDSVDVQPLLGRLLGLDLPVGDGKAEDTLPAMAQTQP
jgi:predicted AlkP superfamily pyrophosphatase or phosphodiesterase